jgi:uncharacterized cupredoxin-like copper-binding protein
VDRLRTAALAGLLIAALAACGGDDSDAGSDGPDEEPSRTIEIDMVDIAFEPDEIEVAAGETVRFVFTNDGEVAHDAFIGDADAQEQHGEDMADDHDGHGDDGEADSITVEPGATGELTHTFSADDESVLIGCHQPGHYEAGMVTTVTVT